MTRMLHKRRALRASAVLVLGGAAALPAWGHDSFVMTRRVNLAPGEPVDAIFLTTDEFPVPDAATAPERVASWVTLCGTSSTPASGLRAGEHALEGTVTAEASSPMVCVVAVALKPRYIEMEPEAFARYLEEEGAAEALAAREAAGAARSPGREVYTKFAKTFVAAGNPLAEEGHSRLAGHALEIVPATTPTNWRLWETVKVRVMLDGAPAAGVRVSIGPGEAGGHAHAAMQTTDANGLVSLQITEGGWRYLRAHVIRPASAETTAENVPEGVRPEWESFFASLAFWVEGNSRTNPDE